MKMTMSVLVNGQDVNHDKLITNKALIELFSNITMYHGFLCGHTSTQGASPVSWSALGWRMEVLTRIRMFSNIRVETWIQSSTRVRVLRNYAVYDEQEELVAKAAGEWVAVDGSTGNFIRITPDLLAPFNASEDENNFPGYRFPDIRSSDLPTAETKLVTPGLQMVDYNDHVHNSEYVNLAGEIFPAGMTCDEIEVVYRTQILPGEPVLLELIHDEGVHKVAIKNPNDHSLHALVIMK